jgi:hypothetical protein
MGSIGARRLAVLLAAIEAAGWAVGLAVIADRPESSLDHVEGKKFIRIECAAEAL